MCVCVGHSALQGPATTVGSREPHPGPPIAMFLENREDEQTQLIGHKGVYASRVPCPSKTVSAAFLKEDSDEMNCLLLFSI